MLVAFVGCMTVPLPDAPGKNLHDPKYPETTGHEPGRSSREPSSRDPRSIRILAKSIYRGLGQSGQRDQDVMQLASELLSLLASDVKGRRRGSDETAVAPAASHDG